MRISCEICGDEVVKRRSESIARFKARKFCGYSCSARGPKNRQPASDRMIRRNANQYGENNPNWKGGVTMHHRMFRKSGVYKKWRKAVLARDNYTCTVCGSKEELQVDHIKPFALFPDLRIDIDNGRVICFPCHKLTPSYGRNLCVYQ